MDDAEETDVALVSSPSNKPDLPSLDLSRLGQLHVEVPLHEQHRQQCQQVPQRYGGQASPSPNANMRGRLRLARLAHLDGNTKKQVSRSVQTAHVKSWLHAHGYVVKADKLHPAVTRVIAEWFQLVDQDGSQTLEHHELMAALKAAQIPCDDATIQEMISLMDRNKDGVIGWDEFEVFMTEQFAAGKSLLSGEYLLPSGTSLNFGVMIGKLKRNKLLRDIMEDPSRRNRWASIANNPDALGRELATMQEAVEATTLTLEHLKRSEGTGAAGATPRSQLTAALMRAMDDSRRLARGLPPTSSLADKLRAGMLGMPGPEPSRREGVAVGEPSCIRPEASLELQPSIGAGGGAGTGADRGVRRACPDPTAAPPTPTASDGGLSACSSLEPLLQAHAQGQGQGQALLPLRSLQSAGGVSGGSPRSGSYNAETVARYLAAQLSCVRAATSSPQPSPLSSPAATAMGPSGAHPRASSGCASPLEWWAGNGLARSAHSHNACSYNGTAVGTTATALPQQKPAASTSASALPLVAYAASYRRPSDAVPAGTAAAAAALATAAGGRQSPCSPLPYCEPTSPARTGLRSGSAGRGITGPRRVEEDRGTSPGPTPGLGSETGRPRRPGTCQVSPEPHHAVTHTACSRAHARPPSRVISQVGLMAKELRAAPGRLSAEPPGLPAAVLAATRGQWKTATCVVVHQGAADAPTADSSGTNSGSAGSRGGGGGGGDGADLGMAAAARGHTAAPADLRAVTPPPPPQSLSSSAAAAAVAPPLLSTYGSSGYSVLPILNSLGQQQQQQQQLLPDLTGGARPSGDGGGGSGSSTASTAAGGGGGGRAAPPPAAMNSPMRMLAATAWEAPASPRAAESSRGDVISPRSSWPSRSPATTCGGGGGTAAAAAAAASGGAVVEQSPTGWPPTTRLADKALRPTSCMLRGGVGPMAAVHPGAAAPIASQGGGSVAGPTVAAFAEAAFCQNGAADDGDGNGNGNPGGVGVGSVGGVGGVGGGRVCSDFPLQGTTPRRCRVGAMTGGRLSGDDAVSAASATSAVTLDPRGFEPDPRSATDTGLYRMSIAAGSFRMGADAGARGAVTAAGDGAATWQYDTGERDAAAAAAAATCDGPEAGRDDSPEHAFGDTGQEHDDACRSYSPLGAAGAKRTAARRPGGNRDGAPGRLRVGCSGDGSGGAGGARRPDPSATPTSALAVAAALLDAMPKRSGGGGSAISAPMPTLELSRSLLGCSLLHTPAVSADGRGGTSCGGSAGAGSPTSDGAAGVRAISPGWAALGLIGPEGRPPSRARSPLGPHRGDEEASESSWQASAASLLQLHLTHQLAHQLTHQLDD